MYIYQLIQETRPNDTALMLYLIELAETERKAFNSVIYAIKQKHIPLTLEAAQTQADKFRNRGAAPPKKERPPTPEELTTLRKALEWAEKMGL